MVFKCCAAYCRSGYDNIVPPNVSFHKFPADEALRNEWIRRISRRDFIPTDSHRLCSLHFLDTDFVLIRQDGNRSRARRKPITPLRRRLIGTAVPSIFQRFPNVSAPSASGDPAWGTSIVVKHEEIALVSELSADDEVLDKIEDFDEIVRQIRGSSTWPKEFLLHQTSTRMFIYNMDFSNDIPRVISSITIRDNFSVSVIWKKRRVHPSEYNHLFVGRLALFSELLALVILLKSWSTSESPPPSVASTISCLDERYAFHSDTKQAIELLEVFLIQDMI